MIQLEPAELLKVQQTVTGMLVDIDRFCQAHDISYYLFYGSALGAVRHHGFIPWDDDADLVLFRSEFERLRACWQADPPEGYFWQDVATDPGYRIKITKIRKCGTAFVEPQVKDWPMHHGLFVDLFVLDDYVKNGFLRRMGEYITMFDYNATRGYLPSGGISRLVYRMTNRVFRSGSIFRWWYRSVFPKLKKDADLCSDIASFTNSHRYDFRREWFGTPQYVAFGDAQLPIPEQADPALRACYGDYLTPPPKEQQISNHKLYHLSFTEEYRP